MTNLEFTKQAEKQGIIIYSIKTLRSKENRGVKITYAHILDVNTVSNEKEEITWNIPKDEVFEIFLYNRWSR